MVQFIVYPTIIAYHYPQWLRCGSFYRMPPKKIPQTEIGIPTMKNIIRSFVSFMKKEDGPTAVEYAVMLSLIIVVCIAAITTLGSNANQAFSYVGSNIKG